MATFHVQIEGLTSIALTSDSSPTEDEVTQYLRDGVREVASRIIVIKPQETFRFCDTTNDTSNINQTGTIVSVAREHDSTSTLRPCEQIDPGLRTEAADVDSLHYRSKYNPGYYILNGTIYTVPAAGGSNNDIVVTQVRYDTSVAHGSSSISYFPDEYEYLVVLYADCKTLLNHMGNVISLITAYAPPNITNAADGGMGYDNTYDITQISTAAWTRLDYDFDNENIDFMKWFQVAGDMIQNQEDLELASKQIDKINSFLTAYQNALANAGAKFDKNFQKYQADYQFLSDRHQKLYSEYIGFFNVLLGQEQAAAQQQQHAQQQARGRR